MENKMNHTPTPWKLSEKRSQTFHILGEPRNVDCIDPISGKRFIDKSPKLIGRVSAGPLLGEEGDANAEFIVRACNGWNDIEALRARLKELENVNR